MQEYKYRAFLLNQNRSQIVEWQFRIFQKHLIEQ
jgi:hypothetical protein